MVWEEYLLLRCHSERYDDFMTADQLEQTVIAYKHRKPFFPFVVEMMDGRAIVVDRPALAIDSTGATFIDSDDNFIDLNFAEVREIRS